MLLPYILLSPAEVARLPGIQALIRPLPEWIVGDPTAQLTVTLDLDSFPRDEIITSRILAKTLSLLPQWIVGDSTAQLTVTLALVLFIEIKS